MSVKQETYLQQRIQTLIKRRGGYIPKKNHGNMITAKGLHDLPFTYRGLSFYFEVKTPDDPTGVSEEQGIHCRLAKKAGGITAIVIDTNTVSSILDAVDYCRNQNFSVQYTLDYLNKFYELGGLDDGTSY